MSSSDQCQLSTGQPSNFPLALGNCLKYSLEIYKDPESDILLGNLKRQFYWNPRVHFFTVYVDLSGGSNWRIPLSLGIWKSLSSELSSRPAKSSCRRCGCTGFTRRLFGSRSTAQTKHAALVNFSDGRWHKTGTIYRAHHEKENVIMPRKNWKD